MKALFLCSWYPHTTQPLGGVFFREQALALRDAGVQVDVVFVEPRSLRLASLSALCKQHFQIVSAREDDLLVVRQLGWNPGMPRGIGGNIYSLLTARLAEKYFEKYGKPDVIHAHCALWAGPAACLLKRKHNIPYVITEHHSAVLLSQKGAAKKALEETYSNADRLLSVSEHLAAAMSKYIPNRQIEIVPNTVDTRFFSQEFKSASAKADGPRVVAVGSLDTNKSHDVLLRAFAKVKAALPSASLTIAGDGKRRSMLEGMACDLNVAHSVRFAGPLSKEGIRDLLRESDMLVHTSKFETFGVTLIEAGAVGIPVVATECGGPTEIVTPVTGRLVAVDDIEAIAKSIEMVWAGSWDSQAIRKVIQDRYSREAIAGRISEIYEEVVHGHRL